MGRRDLIKLTAGAVLAARAGAAAAADAPKFFTPEEFAMVEELTDIVIPTDERSGGARAAGVTAYIDGRFAEAFDHEERDQWRTGLKLVDPLSRQVNGVAFAQAAAEQRVAVVARMAADEKGSKTPEGKFFGELKSKTIEVYYTSKIGIHDDLRYKGNVYQPGDYAGSLPE